MASSSLDVFREVFIEYRSIAAWAVKVSVASPLAALVLPVGPPWPSATGVPIVTAVVEVVILMAVFQFGLGSRRGKKHIESRLRTCGLMLVVGLVVYLLASVFLTFNEPGEGSRAKGFVRRSDLVENLRRVVSEKNADVGKPDLRNLIDENASDAILLELSGYRPTEIWETWSINLVEFLLLIAWLYFFGFLAGFVGLFVVLRHLATGQ